MAWGPMLEVSLRHVVEMRYNLPLPEVAGESWLMMDYGG